jgi:hypothetical protein
LLKSGKTIIGAKIDCHRSIDPPFGIEYWPREWFFYTRF